MTFQWTPLTVHPQEYDTDKGGGQLDYVISAKRRDYYEYALGAFDNILVSLMVIEVLEDVQVRALLGEPEPSDLATRLRAQVEDA